MHADCLGAAGGRGKHGEGRVVLVGVVARDAAGVPLFGGADVKLAEPVRGRPVGSGGDLEPGGEGEDGKREMGDRDRDRERARAEAGRALVSSNQANNPRADATNQASVRLLRFLVAATVIFTSARVHSSRSGQRADEYAGVRMAPGQGRHALCISFHALLLE